MSCELSPDALYNPQALKKRLTDILAIAALGYRISPRKSGSKIPFEKGWHETATSDIATLRRIFGANLFLNAAIMTDDILVVDIDAQGVDSFHNDALESLSCGDDTGRTPCQHTPRGGYHYFFRLDTPNRWKSSLSVLAPGVDIKTGRNHAIMIAPSVLEDDFGNIVGVWRFVEPLRSPSRLPAVPDWLEKELDRIEAQRTQRNREALCIDGPQFCEGQRNTSLFRLAFKFRRALNTDDAPLITDLLNVVNKRCCNPPLNETEVEQIAKSACSRPLFGQSTSSMNTEELMRQFLSLGRGKVL